MTKKKEENLLDTIEGNIWASILLAKAEYKNKPTNPMYSVIICLESTLNELKKIK